MRCEKDVQFVTSSSKEVGIDGFWSGICAFLYAFYRNFEFRNRSSKRSFSSGDLRLRGDDGGTEGIGVKLSFY